MPTGLGTGEQYQRTRQPFDYTGIDVTRPVNMLEPGRYPFEKNFRAYSDGRLSTRPGLAAITTGYIDLHTIARLNDPTALSGAGDYTYIVGDQSQILFGKTALVPRDAGYNGLPFTSITHRPERSPAPLLYLTEGSRMTKWDVAGEPFGWGILPPLVAPVVNLLAPPGVLSITDCTSASPEVTPENGNVWNKSVNATTLTQVDRTNTTVASILYDFGTTGYANIVPTAMGTDIQPGQRILINGAEYILVEQVFAPIKDTTIEGITYVTGTTGECVIQLSTPTTGLLANTVVELGGTEIVRVTSVTNGPSGKPCFRCTTVGTFAATDAVVGLRNFRAYTIGAYGATDTLLTTAYESDITPAGVGNIRHNIPLDLSSVNDRPITDQDEISVGIFIDDITKLIEGRIWLDVDPGTTSSYAATDLSRNYYFYPFRPEDLQRFAVSTDTTTQIAASFQSIQSAQIDQFNTALATRTARDPLTGTVVSFDQLLQSRQRVASGTGGIVAGAKRKLLQKYDEQLGLVGQGGGLQTAPTSEGGNFQAGTGQEQWYQLRIKVGDLIRIGTDNSRSLRDTTSFMVNFNVSGDATVRISSAWIGGSYGPDSRTANDLLGTAYFYRVKPRNSTTGEQGLASPPTRYGVVPRRQQVQLAIQYYSEPTAPGAFQVDKLDIYRYGGSLLQWTYLATVDNDNVSFTAASFTDDISDEMISNNPVLRFDEFAPFPVADLPQVGTCNVVGTRVTLLTGTLNTGYSPGTEIIIDGKAFLFYAQPESATVVELTEAAGTLTDVPFEIQSPIIIGSPLPTVFGPFGQGSSGLYYFALGSNKNPGTVYWTNGNDANSASDLNYLEITSPSEPLIGGAIYDGRPYVWSSERQFYLNQNLGAGLGESQFIAQEVANSKGLWCRTGVWVDTRIYFIGKDGVYESEGGQPVSITDDSLYSLFPHEGQPPSIPAIGEDIRPDFTRRDYMTLTGDGQFVRLIYQDQLANWHMLLWEKSARRWWYDTYGDGGVRVAYADQGQGNYRVLMGTKNGAFAVLAASATRDISDSIPVRLLTPCLDGGDSRAEKRYGDLSLDVAVGANIATVNIYYNNFQSLQSSPQFAVLGRSVQIIDIGAGDETFGVNIGLDITCTCNEAGILELYEWQPSFIIKPERTVLRASDWDAQEGLGAKFYQGFLLEADTLGLDRTIAVEARDGGVIETFTINHNGQTIKPYAFNSPLIAHSVRIIPTDAPESWRLYNIGWVSQPAPEAVSVWEAQETSYGLPGWKHAREAWVSMINPAAVTLFLVIDGVSYSYTIPPGSPTREIEHYVPLRAVKGKIFKPRLVSTQPFRLFEPDSFVTIGAWARTDAYTERQQFGGPSGQRAMI